MCIKLQVYFFLIFFFVDFRFCPEKYFPFDVQNVNKYVVGDDYLPLWEVDSLTKYYNDLGLGMKVISIRPTKNLLIIFCQILIDFILKTIGIFQCLCSFNRYLAI